MVTDEGSRLLNTVKSLLFVGF